MAQEPCTFIAGIFAKYANGKKVMNAADFASFLATEQGEETASVDHAASLISRFYGLSQLEPTSGYNCFNFDEFCRFLSMPELNSLMQITDKPTQEMTAPLSHYFIYSSHNSYLTGNQLTSSSGTAILEKALKAGCRVVELDCWDHKGDIMVLHGHTLTKPVRFDECLRAIKENAFLASDYPVIITIENHLSSDLQRKAARAIRDIFEEMLFVPSLDETPPRLFASPDDLKHKILISDAPPKEPLPKQPATDPGATVDGCPYIVPYYPELDEDDSPPLSPKTITDPTQTQRGIELAAKSLLHHGHSSSGQENKHTRRASELDELIYIISEKLAQIESSVVRQSGDHSVMANLSEPQLKKMAKEDGTSLVKYTQNNLGRMYPFGLRFNSSNPNPYLAWAHGFQMAAINIQGQDRPCWITRALFEGNGKCGFVRKPSILLPTSTIGSTSEHHANPVPKLLLKMRILTFVGCHKDHKFSWRHDFYTRVAIDGHPQDKAKARTNISVNTTITEANWEHQLFEFAIGVPEMAVLRLEVWQSERLNRDRFIGQACVYVAEMKTGLRVVILRSRDGEALLPSSKLLCKIQVEHRTAAGLSRKANFGAYSIS